jgi:hypothetical protein
MKNLMAVFGAAALGAFFGYSVASQRTSVRAAAPTRIEGREFVLRDESGHVAARLSTQNGMTALRFYDNTSGPALEVGVGVSQSSRYIHLFGKDGRLSAALNSQAPNGEATLYLGDEGLQARIIVGALRTDLEANSGPKEWGLQIRRPGSTQSVFSLVSKAAGNTGHWDTGLRILREDGTEWFAH